MDADNKSKQELSEEQKHKSRVKKAIIIGSIAAGTALVAIGAYKLHKNGQFDSLAKLGRQQAGDIKLNDKLMPFSGINRIDESLQDTINNTNTYLGKEEGRNNCTSCVIAGFLRRHGFNVKTTSTGGETRDLFDVVNSCFTIPNSDKNCRNISSSVFNKSSEDASRILKRLYGDNASGVLSTPLRRVPGLKAKSHAINWEINNGQVSFFDAQQKKGNNYIVQYY